MKGQGKHVHCLTMASWQAKNSNEAHCLDVHLAIRKQNHDCQFLRGCPDSWCSACREHGKAMAFCYGCMNMKCVIFSFHMENKYLWKKWTKR